MRLENRVFWMAFPKHCWVYILSAIGSMPRWRLQEEAVSASLYQLLEPPGIRLGMTLARQRQEFPMVEPSEAHLVRWFSQRTKPPWNFGWFSVPYFYLFGFLLESTRVHFWQNQVLEGLILAHVRGTWLTGRHRSFSPLVSTCIYIYTYTHTL